MKRTSQNSNTSENDFRKKTFSFIQTEKITEEAEDLPV